MERVPGEATKSTGAQGKSTVEEATKFLADWVALFQCGGTSLQSKCYLRVRVPP